MSTHTYPRSALTPDYIRAGCGLALTALPLALLPMHWVLAVLFGAAALLFAAFLFGTVQRHLTIVTVDDGGIISRGPAGVAIAWPELRRMRLSYYSTRRDKQNGWMTLVLKGRGRKLSLESSLTAFESVVEQAHRAAEAGGLDLSPTTLENLMVLGVLRRPSGLSERWGLAPSDDEAGREARQ